MATNYIYKLFHGSTEYEIKDQNLRTELTQLWKKFYPVGSIYVAANATSPATLFGGTWEELGSGYLRSASAYGTGGSDTTQSITLAAANLPAHNHTFTTSSNGAHTHSAISNGNHSHSAISAGAHTHGTSSMGAHTHTASAALIK